MNTALPSTPSSKWIAYPMGGKGAEYMERRGKNAFHSHAVLTGAARALCGVRADFLCVDSSLAEPLPDCPVCLRKAQGMGRG